MPADESLRAVEVVYALPLRRSTADGAPLAGVVVPLRIDGARTIGSLSAFTPHELRAVPDVDRDALEQLARRAGPRSGTPAASPRRATSPTSTR